MEKRKFAILTLTVCLLLIVSMFCGCNVVSTDSDNNSTSSGSNDNENNNVASEYKLTVKDPNGYTIEQLQEQYQAGEEVTVRTKMLDNVDLGAYLDGVFLGFGSKVNRKINSQWQFCWEFYFTMPEHDAVLSFQVPEGLTKNGITLDEAKQTEIKTAFYNTYKDKHPDLVFEKLSLRCYGAFDGVYVIFEDGVWGCIAAVTSEVIAGVKFIYADGLHMTVYCDNAFYTISEAYEKNILSYENLLATQENYKACAAYLYYM